MTVEAVLASACLPQMFPAVEIGEEAYWDGGFAGNPALYPLIDNRASQDIVVVQINPIVRRNRLNLLSRIRQICLSVADLTKLEG